MPSQKGLDLLDLVTSNEQLLRDWTKQRPAINSSYEDLLDAVKNNEISKQVYPEKDWAGAKKKYDAGSNSGGFYQPSSQTMHIPERNVGTAAVPHELLHYFSSHKNKTDKPFYRGVPQINPYIKADIKMKGWLPSLHPAGRRPTIKGDSALAKAWNKRFATGQTKYSNEKGYHPWYDEEAFDKTADKMLESYNLGKGNQPIKFKGDYPIYNKQSDKAKSFRNTFSTARQSGAETFEWDGRKYTTELKK